MDPPGYSYSLDRYIDVSETFIYIAHFQGSNIMGNLFLKKWANISKTYTPPVEDLL